MNDLPRASVKQLANKIKGFGRHPRFAFFLGAGASRQSGIITASEMISFFKERIIDECCPNDVMTGEERDIWLAGQDWHKKTGSVYCKLFEQYEPKEIGRQRYIESIIEGQEPSFGYVVLANLIASGYINTIITTNFDDLVYTACTSYTSIRPIVYAYGVLASEMRITAQRPKILKLHGDYLYSTLKNTSSETSVQDPNMARQVRQVLNEYGLVVMGYAGDDESIIEILSDISEKNDLYWCVMRGTEPNEAVTTLLDQKGGFIVEIDGFDETMNEIRHVVGFDVANMVGSINERQTQIIERLKGFEPGYSADLLGEIVEVVRKQPREEGQKKMIQSVDLFNQAFKAQQQNDHQKAETLYRKAISLDPNHAHAYNNLAAALVEGGKITEAEQALRKAIELNPNFSSAHGNLGLVLTRDKGRQAEAEACIRKGMALDPKDVEIQTSLLTLLRLQHRYEDALEVAEKLARRRDLDIQTLISLVSVYKYVGNETKAARYAELARSRIKPDDWYQAACLESLCGNIDQAIENLAKALEKGLVHVQWARDDPDFEQLRDDPRFAELVTPK